VVAVRDALVSWETAVTDAPAITDPDLSETVPVKLAFAWPYTLGETHSAAQQANVTKSILFLIVDTPFRHPKVVAIMQWQHKTGGPGYSPTSPAPTENT
jgi:hypothetical protein